MSNIKEEANLTLQTVQLMWINKISELIGSDMEKNQKHFQIEWHLAFLEGTVPNSIKKINPIKYPEGWREKIEEIGNYTSEENIRPQKNIILFHKIMEWISTSNRWYDKGQIGSFDELSSEIQEQDIPEDKS